MLGLFAFGSEEFKISLMMGGFGLVLFIAGFIADSYKQKGGQKYKESGPKGKKQRREPPRLIQVETVRVAEKPNLIRIMELIIGFTPRII